LGDVVEDFIEVEAEPFIMRGNPRTEMLSSYIVAIENGEIISPYIRHMEQEHRYASVDDVYGRGHLPDTIAAGALAWLAKGDDLEPASARAEVSADVYKAERRRR
jgi:hypothetical protein